MVVIFAGTGIIASCSALQVHVQASDSRHTVDDQSLAWKKIKRHTGVCENNDHRCNERYVTTCVSYCMLRIEMHIAICSS